MNKEPIYTATRELFGGWPRVTLLTRGVTASWKRFGDGANCLQAYFANPLYVQVTASETHYADKLDGDKARNVTKEVMLSMNVQRARAMRDFLNEFLGEKVK